MGCAVLGSCSSHCALSVGGVALLRGWTELLGICSEHQGHSSVQLVCAAPKDILLFVLEGAVGQLKGSAVYALHCPYYRFLTALTSPEYSKVCLSCVVFLASLQGVQQEVVDPLGFREIF